MKLPLFKRLGFQIFLFNLLLLISVIFPGWLIWRADYQNLQDHILSQRKLFRTIRNNLQYQSLEDWSELASKVPMVFDDQRVFLFDDLGNPLFEQGTDPEGPGLGHLPLILPHPYRDTNSPSPMDASAYAEALKRLPDAMDRDYSRLNQITWTIETPEGLDRILVMAQDIHSRDGDFAILVVSSSLLDILLQRRAMKERFLLILLTVGIMAMLLSLFLSRRVIRPFQELNSRSSRLLHGTASSPTSGAGSSRNEIHEICRALELLISEQKRYSETMRDFSNDVVHELKTPLSAIRSGLELYTESTDPDEQEQLADRIRRRILQMEEMMDEIGTLGRFSTASAEESCPEVLMALEDIHDLFPGVRYSGIDAQWLQGITLPIEKDKFIRIISNLLTNAISLSPEPGTVGLSLEKADSNLIIKATDHGPGIAPEVFSHITRRFYSYRPGDTGSHMGLGLAIVHTVLESCQGRLSYGNTPEGAQFTIEIPYRSE